MGMRKNKTGVKLRFDPLEVPGLIEKAKSGDLEARDELVFRFQRLVATLVQVCLTGRPNYFSSYQKTFLQMFVGKNVPLTKIAARLKIELSLFEKDELFSTGQLAIYNAIEKCETNLASTIVYCFKELIYSMIKDPKDILNYDELEQIVTPSFDDQITMDLFLEDLDEAEWILVQKILDGEKIKPAEITPELQAKVKKHYDVNI